MDSTSPNTSPQAAANATTTDHPMAPHNDVEAFHQVLRSSRRIIAVCGAGLSASSGLPTFRGAGGLWRNYNVMDIATPDAFDENPGLVWQVRFFKQFGFQLSTRVQLGTAKSPNLT